MNLNDKPVPEKRHTRKRGSNWALPQVERMRRQGEELQGFLDATPIAASIL